MLERNRYAPALALGIYLFNLVVWERLAFHWLFPRATAEEHLLLQHRSPVLLAGMHFLGLPAFHWLSSLLLTAIGEAPLPLLLFLLVARPCRLSPLLGRRQPRALPLLMSTVAAAGALAYTRAPLDLATAIAMLEFMMAGLLEEWSFRGVLTRVFADRVGLLPAALLVSAGFGLSHVWEIAFHGGATWSGAAAGSAIGLFMTWVVWRSGSILWGAMIHGLFDWLQAATGSWTGLVVLALFSIAILGAEMLRLAARRPSPVRTGSTAATP